MPRSRRGARRATRESSPSWPDEVRTLLDIVRTERGHLEGFDVALITAPGAEIVSPARRHLDAARVLARSHPVAGAAVRRSPRPKHPLGGRRVY